MYKKNNPSLICIITGGHKADFTLLKPLLQKEDPYIIAADSGLDYCAKWSLIPDEILGDMDSLQDKNLLKAYGDAKLSISPCDKDYTDTELGLIQASLFKDTPILLWGGGGGRPDHFLGIKSILEGSRFSFLWVTHNSIIQRVTKGVYSLYFETDKIISVFPCWGEGSKHLINSHGLFWPLGKVNWPKMRCSLSNRAETDCVELEVKQGKFILIQALDPSVLNIYLDSKRF